MINLSAAAGERGVRPAASDREAASGTCRGSAGGRSPPAARRSSQATLAGWTSASSFSAKARFSASSIFLISLFSTRSLMDLFQ